MDSPDTKTTGHALLPDLPQPSQASHNSHRFPITLPRSVRVPVASASIAPLAKKRKRESKSLQPLILAEDVCHILAKAVACAPSPQTGIIHLIHIYDLDLAHLTRALESNYLSPFPLLGPCLLTV